MKHLIVLVVLILTVLSCGSALAAERESKILVVPFNDAVLNDLGVAYVPPELLHQGVWVNASPGAGLIFCVTYRVNDGAVQNQCAFPMANESDWPTQRIELAASNAKLEVLGVSICYNDGCFDILPADFGHITLRSMPKEYHDAPVLDVVEELIVKQ